MNIIEELITKSRLELEKNNQDTSIVGNRPHYPMLVLLNENFGNDEHATICNILRRVWPQALKYIVSYRYTISSDTDLTLTAYKNSVTVNTDEFLSSLDEAKMARDVFASMQQWCVYNVVDTTDFNSVEEFERYYNAYKHIDATVVDAHKTMLIVLLNDSAAKRSTAKAIRTFLAEKTELDYDATVILSNRDRNNQMYAISDLYRIVANIFILSNNDSVSVLDDADYSNRVSVFYSRTPYIVSYILLDKPIDKIAIQINDTILDEALRVVNETKVFDLAGWTKKFGFDNSRCQICEDYIKRVDPQIDHNIFLHLPMKAIPEKLDLSRMFYSQLKRYIFDDVFEGFVSDYCEHQLTAEFDTKECVDEFRDFVVNTFTSAELCNLSDELIDNLISKLNSGVANENAPIGEYFNQCVQFHLRKNILYPAFKTVLRELRSKSENNLKLFEKFRNDYKTYLPLKMQELLGNLYANMVSVYLQTEQGEKSIRAVLSPSNDEEAFAEKVFACLKNIVAENKETFSLSFIEEWALRLGQSGDAIYKKISNELTTGADDAICLCGNYALDKRLKVIMLHTGDSNGNNPTALYGHVKQTFSEDSLVQYFNTGYDDAMEAITFIACRGADLII